MADLESGEAAANAPPCTCLWYDRRGKLQPPRKRLWNNVSSISFFSAYLFVFNLFSDLDNTNHEDYFGILELAYLLTYTPIFMYVYRGRLDPSPYKLSRSEKRLFESAFVVVCSGWTYLYREGDLMTSALVLDLFFNVVPLLNIWWSFVNFSLWDCGIFVIIDAALLCFRDRGRVVFAAVAGACVALQLIKDPFRRYWSGEFERSAEEEQLDDLNYVL